MMQTLYRWALACFLAMLGQSLIAQSLYLPPRTIYSGSQQTLDTASYTITYTFRIKLNPKEAKVSEDLVALQVGKRYTRFYSLALAQTDSAAVAAVSAGKKVYRGHQGFAMREDIYQDLRAQTLFTTYRTMAMAPILYYEDVLPSFAWSIGTEQKTILGYPCTEARLNYRGREYTAWFAPSLPIPYGPWTFAGLPGLILEIEDTKGEVQFTAVGIVGDRQEPIRFWDIGYHKSTPAKAKMLIKKMHKQPYAFFRTFMPNGMIGADGEVLTDRHSLAYNPIELE